jgi:ATP-dependent Clp protease adaptor protein ClpS
MADKDNGNGNGTSTGVVVKAKPKTKKPSMYKVLLLNDDYTPMEFVVHILERFFGKSTEEANRIMLHVSPKPR